MPQGIMGGGEGGRSACGDQLQTIKTSQSMSVCIIVF